MVAIALLFTSCNKNDDENPKDPEGQLPMVFKVDPLLYKQYEAEDPNYSTVSVYAWAVFTQQPTATKYTLKYTCTTAPNLSFEISWKNGDAIPAPGAPAPTSIIPGYELGVIGGDYYIVILRSGCQGSVGGDCVVNGPTPNMIEDNLRAIEGEVEVTIEFE